MATMDVELFECERYRPMLGWSSDYLLPTDKNAYRVRACKKTWRSISEAESALLAPGWSWEESRDVGGKVVGWEVDADGKRTDTEGWIYGANFSSNFEGSAKGAIQMFTRWRRLVRTQTFAGPEVLTRAVSTDVIRDVDAFVCPNVDLEGALHIGRLLLEALAAASLYGEVSAPALVQLKLQLVQRFVAKKGGQRESLEAALAGFVSTQRGVATRVAEAFKGVDDSALVARIADTEKGFSAIEQEAFAVLAIRHLRPELTCPSTDPNHVCALQAVLCQHVGCKVRCSAQAVEAHDSSCLFKLLPCEKCGEHIPRAQLRVHSTVACPLREASCTFGAIGCQAPLNHRDVAEHLERCTQSHLMLLLQTVLEQQDVIRSLSARVYELESRTAASENADRAAQTLLTGQIVGLESKLVALEKQSGKDLKKVADSAADDAKKKADSAAQDARKHADKAVASTQKDLNSLRTEVGVVKASLSELKNMPAELAGLKTSVAGLAQESAVARPSR